MSGPVMMPGEQPPHDAEAEKALAASLIVDPSAAARIRGSFDPSAVFILRNRWVCEAALDLSERGAQPDIVTVADELQKRGQLEEAGGSARLVELMNSVPSALHIDDYLRIVQEKARQRRMLDVASLWAQAGYASDGRAVGLLTRARELDRELVADEAGLDWAVYSLSDAFAERSSPEFIIEPIIRCPGLVMPYSAPNRLKSLLLMDGGLCVAGGIPWLGPLPNGDGPPGYQTMQIPVLWLDFDNGIQRTHDRVEALARGHELQPGAVPFYYTSMPSPWLSGSDTMSVDSLIALAKRLSVGAVFIDNLGAVSGDADENKAEMGHVMSNFRRLAEETTSAVVIIHHQRKATGFKARAGETLRGHSSIEAALDLALLIDREEGSDTVTVKSTKSRGADVPPFGAIFTYEHKPGTRDLARARFFGRAVEDNSRPARARRAVLAVMEQSTVALNKGELSEAAKAAATDVGLNCIRSAIDELAAKGRLSMRPGPRGAQLYSPLGD